MERDEPLFDLYAFLPDCEKEIGAGVRIDNGLETRLALLERRERDRRDVWAAATAFPHRAQEIANDPDIGVQGFIGVGPIRGQALNGD